MPWTKLRIQSVLCIGNTGNISSNCSLSDEGHSLSKHLLAVYPQRGAKSEQGDRSQSRLTGTALVHLSAEEEGHLSSV